MGVRELAEQDLEFIMEDEAAGPGWPIQITDPNGAIGNLKGIANDIAQIIDPDTGEPVTGRSASISVRISSLTAEGLEIPVGVADTSGKPWLVAFDDINGNAFIFKVSKSAPDRAMGTVTCWLENYIP